MGHRLHQAHPDIVGHLDCPEHPLTPVAPGHRLSPNLLDYQGYQEDPRSSDYVGSFGLGRPSDTSLESTFFSKLSADETLARGGSSVAVDALSFQQRLAFPSHIQVRKKFS